MVRRNKGEAGPPAQPPTGDEIQDALEALRKDIEARKTEEARQEEFILESEELMKSSHIALDKMLELLDPRNAEEYRERGETIKKNDRDNLRKMRDRLRRYKKKTKELEDSYKDTQEGFDAQKH